MFFQRKPFPEDEREIEELVGKANTGDVEAFGELYECLVEQIYRYLYFKVNIKQEAEDLTQETFAKAFRNLKKFKGGSFKSWIYTIAKNNLIDFYRGTKKEVSFDEALIARQDDKIEDNLDKKDLLEKALKLLPDKYKEVIIWRYLEDQSVAVTARILKTSEENVRVISHRGLKQLKDILEKMEQTKE